MERTIAAISTAVSASGIGIIRISGEESMDVISRIYRSKGGKKDIRKAASHTIHYGYIYDGDELVDEVLVMIMKAPRTFTGEDTVEIDCHGGPVPLRRTLRLALRLGARPAEPGEFTKAGSVPGRGSDGCDPGKEPVSPEQFHEPAEGLRKKSNHTDPQ